MLSGEDRRQIRVALLAAFPTIGELAQLCLYEYGQPLSSITATGPMGQVIFELIEYGVAQGKLHNLVHGARRMNPGNPLLRDVQERLFPQGTANTMPQPAPATEATVASTATQEPFQPIAEEHRRGFILLMAATLHPEVVGEDALVAAQEATRIWDRICDSSATYMQMREIERRVVERAVDRTLGADHDLPETRIATLYGAFSQLNPASKVCPHCGNLNLTLVGGRWAMDTLPTCERPPCRRLPDPEGNIYRAVKALATFAAWTTRERMTPGTTHDADRLPLTQSGVLDYLGKNGLTLHAWFTPSFVDEKLLVPWLAYSLWRPGHPAYIAAPHSVPMKIRALKLLANPTETYADETAFRLELRKFRAWYAEQREPHA